MEETERTAQAQSESAQSAEPAAESPLPSFRTLIEGRYREDFLDALEQALSAQARETERYLAYRDLLGRAEAVKAAYPEFELEKELDDPAFARLVENGVEPKTAYEVVHHEELRRREASLARNAARPQENGLAGAASAVSRPDPRSLTRQERRALRRRAARGEEIVW